MASSVSPINSDEFLYIIGIDFGTTYSGAGYLYIPDGTCEDVVDIKSWPKVRNFNSYAKVPTAIRYHKKDKTKYKWGKEAIDISPRSRNEYGDVIRMFKLRLQEDILTLDDEPGFPHNLDVIQVVADYLKATYANICNEMKKNIGDENFEQRKDKFRFCLTVPAIWKQPAKTKMREAAIRAGIINQDDHTDRLILISEPEAAAVYVENMRGGVKFEEEETILICDAGGGTIDLCVFKKEKNCLKEITEGDGMPEGSIHLDKRFRQFLMDKFKDSNLGAENIDFSTTVSHFTEIEKVQIGYHPSDEIILFPLPNRFDVNIEMKDFIIYKDMHKVGIKVSLIEKDVFDPVIHIIVEHIKNQLLMVERQAKNLDYIILVGGFGRNQYLLKKLKQEFDSKVKKIIIPDDAELAVTRGSVYFGFDPYSISHRTMRYTYGIKVTLPFKDGDKEEYKYEKDDNEVVCINRFDIFARKGQLVSTLDYVERPLFTQNSIWCPLEIFAADSPSPRYITDDNVHKIAYFRLELPPRPDTQKQIDFKLRMYFGHTELKAEVIIPSIENKIFKATIE